MSACRRGAPGAGLGAKTPPSLSSIQWRGALRRFMCFFGPRTICRQAGQGMQTGAAPCERAAACECASPPRGGTVCAPCARHGAQSGTARRGARAGARRAWADRSQGFGLRRPERAPAQRAWRVPPAAGVAARRGRRVAAARAGGRRRRRGARAQPRAPAARQVFRAAAAPSLRGALARGATGGAASAPWRDCAVTPKTAWRRNRHARLLLRKALEREPDSRARRLCPSYAIKEGLTRNALAHAASVLSRATVPQQ